MSVRYRVQWESKTNKGIERMEYERKSDAQDRMNYLLGFYINTLKYSIIEVVIEK